MAISPIKVLLFLAGGTVAAGVTAYGAGVFDPYLGKAPPQVASAPEPPKVAALPPAADAPASEPPAAAAPPPATEPPAATAPADGGTEAATPPAAAEPGTQAPDASAPAAEAPPAAPSVQPPTFDLVRAEANGALVIAGHAAAKAKVEIVLGSRILGSTVAGDEGDFAIVIDEPLKPGDYQLVLRSTTPDNVVAMSQETAVVSIPETADGQVLALVEQPGQAAKLITVPAAPPQDPAEAAEAVPPAVAAAQPEAPPAQPEAPPTGEAAAAPPAPEEVAPPPAPAATAKVAVEAVEIEGRKIFVAGAADAGVLVRGYANEILLGETKASPAGRFLIEAERDLPVGDYIIRVDVIGADGVKVVARAAVPFEREPGENLAAVAPPTPAPAEAPASPPAVAEAPAPADATPPAMAAAPAEPAAPPATAEAPSAPAEASPPAVAQAPAALAPEPSSPPATAEAPAAAAAPEPETASSEPASPPAAADAPAAPAEPAPPAVAEAPAAAPAPADTAPAETAPAAIAEAPPAQEPAAPGTEAASPPAVAAAPAPAEEVPATVAAAPEPAPGEALAPKLQAVDGAVIIRRGDTLWRISKRVYGRGVRFSTIYLANQQQIRDPDRIWPGQVFSVPDTSKEGEPADMKQLGEQAVKIVPYNG